MMKEFDYTIKSKNGLHARPAGMLATVAKKFESDISVSCADKRADGKRLLSLMALGAKAEAQLHFEISGIDEEKASKALLEHLDKESV